MRAFLWIAYSHDADDLPTLPESCDVNDMVA